MAIYFEPLPHALSIDFLMFFKKLTVSNFNEMVTDLTKIFKKNINENFFV